MDKSGAAAKSTPAKMQAQGSTSDATSGLNHTKCQTGSWPADSASCALVIRLRWRPMNALRTERGAETGTDSTSIRYSEGY